MKTISSLLSLGLLFTACMSGCDSDRASAPESTKDVAESSQAVEKQSAAVQQAAADAVEPKVITPASLAERLKSSEPPKVFDANGQRTREKYGVVPGATLLSSASGYDVNALLPKDKSESLVFYCANTHCSAAEGAAERATEAGYSDVSVMPEGIRGWKEAGLPLNQI